MTTEYEDLANAIVVQASIDYRAALKRLKHVPEKERQDILDKLLKEEEEKDTVEYKLHLTKRKKSRTSLERAVWTKYECEGFFSSEWFGVLTTLDGNMLLRKLQEETI